MFTLITLRFLLSHVPLYYYLLLVLVVVSFCTISPRIPCCAFHGQRRLKTITILYKSSVVIHFKLVQSIYFLVHKVNSFPMTVPHCKRSICKKRKQTDWAVECLNMEHFLHKSERLITAALTQRSECPSGSVSL